MCAQRLLKIRLVVTHQDWPVIAPSRTLSVASSPRDFTRLHLLPRHLKTRSQAKRKTASVWMHGKDSCEGLHINMAPSEGQVQNIMTIMLR